MEKKTESERKKDDLDFIASAVNICTNVGARASLNGGGRKTRRRGGGIALAHRQ